MLSKLVRPLVKYDVKDHTTQVIQLHLNINIMNVCNVIFSRQLALLRCCKESYLVHITSRETECCRSL